MVEHRKMVMARKDEELRRVMAERAEHIRSVSLEKKFISDRKVENAKKVAEDLLAQQRREFAMRESVAKQRM